MMRHRLNAYKDDAYKWVMFCENCGQEEPQESQECPGKNIPTNKRIFVDTPNQDDSLIKLE